MLKAVMQVNMRREERYRDKDKYSLCWEDQKGHTVSVEVESVNLSQSGMLIRSAQQLLQGAAVYIQATNGGLAAHALVRRCVARGDRYEVALEFNEKTKATQSAANNDIDYYEFLQISPKADFGTIQRIHRIMAGRFHPDNPETGDPEKFLILQAAYEVLSDPKRRGDYDTTRQMRDSAPLPIFELSEFVNGIEGEVNRRLGILSLLYNKRRTSPHDPGISVFDLEKRMGMPREYLDFTTWYLKSKQYITSSDNAELALTAVGVDYVESNCSNMPILQKLLQSGPKCATSSPQSADHAPHAVRFLNSSDHDKPTESAE
jgi:hypothetical protein